MPPDTQQLLRNCAYNLIRYNRNPSPQERQALVDWVKSGGDFTGSEDAQKVWRYLIKNQDTETLQVLLAAGPHLRITSGDLLTASNHNDWLKGMKASDRELFPLLCARCDDNELESGAGAIKPFLISAGDHEFLTLLYDRGIKAETKDVATALFYLHGKGGHRRLSTTFFTEARFAHQNTVAVVFRAVQQNPQGIDLNGVIGTQADSEHFYENGWTHLHRLVHYAAQIHHYQQGGTGEGENAEERLKLNAPAIKQAAEVLQGVTLRLIQLGADPTIKDRYSGRTPAEFARYCAEESKSFVAKDFLRIMTDILELKQQTASVPQLL